MQEESGFEDELTALNFLSFDPIMVAEQFTLMDAVRPPPPPFQQTARFQVTSILAALAVCFVLTLTHPYTLLWPPL